MRFCLEIYFSLNFCLKHNFECKNIKTKKKLLIHLFFSSGHFVLYFFSPIGGHLIRRPLATTRARSGDLFIMGASDIQVTAAPYEGTDSFTSIPYQGFEPGNLGVAVGSPIHYTSWSAPDMNMESEIAMSTFRKK